MTREESIKLASEKDLETNLCVGIKDPNKEDIRLCAYGSFILGAKWADNNPVNPWHKASEELPKEEGTYLLRFWAGCSFQIFIGSYRNGKFGALTMEDGDYVTHWMPIPKLPKED